MIFVQNFNYDCTYGSNHRFPLCTEQKNSFKYFMCLLGVFAFLFFSFLTSFLGKPWGGSGGQAEGHSFPKHEAKAGEGVFTSCLVFLEFLPALMTLVSGCFPLLPDAS